MSFTLEQLTQAPEFEKNCDAFIAKIWRASDKYSSISIMAFNETKYVLDPETMPGDGIAVGLAALIMKVGNIEEDLVEKVRNSIKKERIEEEKNSASQNRGSVEVFGLGNETSLAEMEKFLLEIEKLAIKYKGAILKNNILLNGPQALEYSKNDEPLHRPLAHVEYIFK